METGYSLPLFISLSALAIMALAGCSSSNSSNPPPKSTDFSTSAIEADFAINVLEDDVVQLKAIFYYQGDSIELDTGDSVSVIGNSDEFNLIQSTDTGDILYTHTYTTSSTPTLFNFVFNRTTQETADLSIIPTPDAFSILNMVNGQELKASNGMIDFEWTPASSGSDRFFLRYHLECRHQSGTPSIIRDFAELVDDDGNHNIDVLAILGEGEYDFCTDFDITAERERFGSLDAAFSSGSTTGKQIRSISNLSITSL